MFPKTKRIEDKKHLKLIRQLPCCICGRVGVEVHHIRMGNNGGIGRKPGDSLCVPLCSMHHRELHNTGERRFWGNLDTIDLANKLYKNPTIETVLKWKSLK